MVDEARMTDHQHNFVFTRDLTVLNEIARELDWPVDAEGRIDRVERCECGALNRVEWTRRRGGENEIPDWIVNRLLEHKREHEL
jgi:hypothetical protein